MNEAFKRRLVGLLTLAAIALLLSWLLPRPGLHRLDGGEERVAAMDLTKPGSPAQEVLPETPQDAKNEGAKPKGAEGPTLFPLPADPNAPAIDAAAEEEPGPDEASSSPAKPIDKTPADKAMAESIAAERAASAKAATEKAAADKIAADQAAAAKAAADKTASDKALADKAAAERVAAQKAAIEKATADKAAADKVAADKAAAERAAAEKAASSKAIEKPASPPAASKPATPAPSPTTTAAAPAKPDAAGTWYAQCGVYSMLENAQSLRGELAQRGMNCDLAPVDSPKGTVYRVRCGPFKSRGEAEIVVSRIKDRVQAIVVDGAH